MNISIQCDPVFFGDRIFSFDPKLNRDNCLEPFRALKTALEKRGGTVGTADLVDPLNADIVLDLDSYGKENILKRLGRSYLIALESPIVRPENYRMERYAPYSKVFTWYRGLSTDKIVPISIPVPLKSMTVSKEYYERKLLCLISGNKNSRHPTSLYQERIRITRWFERHFPKEWGLYGMGWEKGVSLIPYTWQKGPLKKVAPFFRKKFPSFKGAPDRKSEVYQDYRFALAFENAEGHPGYITEKIFDPMMSGCVPIYRGAPDITRLVPEDCFIDGRRFSNPESMRKYLIGMSQKRWEEYRTSMKQFLSSSVVEELSSEKFGEVIANVILEMEK